VIVGSEHDELGGDSNGAVYVFPGSATGVSTNYLSRPSLTGPGAEFGSSVAGVGDVNGDGSADVIIGAPNYGAGGTAFVLHGGAQGVIGGSPASAARSILGGQATAFFGYSLAAAGDVNGDGYGDLIVGAHAYDAGQTDEGAAFVFLGSASGIAATGIGGAATTIEGNQTSAFLGSAVASAGDVNGDGYDDVIVGAPNFPSNLAAPTNDGQVQIFLGGPTGLSQTPQRTLTGTVGARKGISVASAGDVNGDGFDDVIIGSDFVGVSGSQPRFEIYHGSATGIGASPARTVLGPALSELGYSVNGAGDVNHDGFDDVIVGQHDYTNGESGEGRASVYLGSAAGIAATPVWAVESNLAGTSFGISVDGAGDVNGDGFDDIIVGHYRFGSGGQTREGRAQVFLGSATGPALTPAWTVESNQAFAEFGVTVAGAGDVNHDGFGDVIVGAWQWDGAFGDSGHAWVYLGSASGLSTTPTWQADGEALSAGLGWTVAGVGDMNGDGFDDVAAGSASYGVSPNAHQGRVYVFYGRASGVEPTPSRIYQSEQGEAQAGRGLGGAGDVNGDGFDDLAMGAYLYDNGQTNEGRAYIQQGSAALPTYTFRKIYDNPFGSVGTVRIAPNERSEFGLQEDLGSSHFISYLHHDGFERFSVVGSSTGVGQFSTLDLRGIDATGHILFQGFYDTPDPRGSGIDLWQLLTGTREVFSRLKSAGGYIEAPSGNDVGDLVFVDQDGRTGNLRRYHNFVLEPSLAACTQMTMAAINDAGTVAYSCGNFSSQSIFMGTPGSLTLAVDQNSFSPADPGGNTAIGIDASGTLAFNHFGNTLSGLYLKHPSQAPVLLDAYESCFSYDAFNEQGRALCNQGDSLRITAEPSVVQSHEVVNVGTVLDGKAITSFIFGTTAINDLGQIAFTVTQGSGGGATSTAYMATPTSCDQDKDGFCDAQDNCPTTANSDQRDFDGDGIGNTCDNCPLVKNADQLDTNGDGRGDACLPCNTSGTTLPLCGTITVGAGTTTFSIPNVPIGALPSRPVFYAGARSLTSDLSVDAH
ncbi:MAG: FG-GAP-like repeat-containing protein, partial [bacterium]